MDAKKTICVIEDSPEDFIFISRAFKEVGIMNNIFHLQEGDEAIDYFRRNGKYANDNAPALPGMVFLDLNLPGASGKEVLEAIKSNAYLRKIPVIILSTSGNETDIEECYAIGANSYICKPMTFQGLVEAMGFWKRYWFETALLPAENS